MSLDANHIFKRCNQMKLIKDGKEHPGYVMTALACSIIKRTDNPDYSVLHRGDDKTKERIEDQVKAITSRDRLPARCEDFAHENPEGCMNCLENVRSPLGVIEAAEYERFLKHSQAIATMLNENLDKTIIIAHAGKESYYALTTPKSCVSIRVVRGGGLVQVDESLLKQYVDLSTPILIDNFHKLMQKYKTLISRHYVNLLEFTDYYGGEVVCYSFDTTKLNK